ncbi:hypothetical protein B9T33_05115 [Acinetobacter sp. ANC 5054]|uniref:hypothetical protein n=1 Tax=Acinetobacter sp. ANC 5054 TaxID=1977877 RepID=UPI000A32C5F3|nr:hypothetical protein [Acinetobacter sp. ANC 5054]OTG81907.1 hypothetical protein B9T33_05115 [Acinetobacter sp. ANC 5054]
MLKMIDVLEQQLVQNFSDSLFTQTDAIDDLFHEQLKTVADIDLQNLISQFFSTENALEVAQDLDIQADQIEAIQSGADLKDESLVTATAKIVAYCLVIETNILHQVEVFESLQDYPM